MASIKDTIKYFNHGTIVEYVKTTSLTPGAYYTIHNLEQENGKYGPYIRALIQKEIDSTIPSCYYYSLPQRFLKEFGPKINPFYKKFFNDGNKLFMLYNGMKPMSNGKQYADIKIIDLAEKLNLVN